MVRRAGCCVRLKGNGVQIPDSPAAVNLLRHPVQSLPLILIGKAAGARSKSEDLPFIKGRCHSWDRARRETIFKLHQHIEKNDSNGFKARWPHRRF